MADATFDTTECAQRARQFLTEQSESVDLSLPRIFSVIQSCLETYARECFEDRHKRELFKTTFEVPIVSGQADLSTYIDGTDGKINLRELKQNPIYSGTDTYTWVSSLNQLANTRMVNGKACFLEGTTLRTRIEDQLDGTDTVTFTVTNYPTTTSDIPVELQGEFVKYVASQFLPNTAPQFPRSGAQ